MKHKTQQEEEVAYGVTPAGDEQPVEQGEVIVAEEAPATVPAEQFDALKAERDALFDRLARLQAEFDNARKRQEREKQEFRDYATGNVVEQFLPVVDNFALALTASANAEQLRQGVELIVKQMDEVLQIALEEKLPELKEETLDVLAAAMPPMPLPCPPSHLVSEWMTISAPCSIGRSRCGVVKVLSTISGRPLSCAIFEIASMSETSSDGLPMVSV